MGTAKDIIIKVLPAKIANDFIKKHHYSGKIVKNSSLHFGCFLNNKLHRVMSFGSPMDKRKVLGLVVDTHGKPAEWNGMLELNRMAFDEVLPRNSESRCISIALKMIKRKAPHIKWVLSFADGTHCGDGTIYRASGFKLTGMSKASMIELPEKYWKYNGGGRYAHRMTLQAKSNTMYKIMNRDLGLNGEYKPLEWYAKKLGTNIVEGSQLRYIYVLDNNYSIVPAIIPFSEIDRREAGMYKGERIAQAERHKK